MNYVKDLLIDTFYGADQSSSNQLLRYKGRGKYGTTFGAFTSIAIYIFFIYMSISKFIEAVNKTNITSTLTTQNLAIPSQYNLSTYSGTHFMFAVNIIGLDLNTGNRYFDIALSVEKIDNLNSAQSSSVTYKLQPCSYDHWSDVPSIWDDMLLNNVNDWLCAPKNQTFPISGNYHSNISEQLIINIQSCTNSFDPTRSCRNQTQLDQYFQKQGGTLIAQLNFINPLLNTGDKDYLSYYLEDNNFIYFNNQMAEDAFLFVEEFRIDTDHSLFFSQTNIYSDLGWQIPNFAIKNSFKPSNTSSSINYGSFNILKSGNSNTYSRSFYSLNDWWSYVGGLIGTVVFMFFFFSMYNQHAYDVNLGKSLYHPDYQRKKNDIQNDQKEDKNLQGTIYSKYNFMAMIGQICLKVWRSCKRQPHDWHQIKAYEACKEEMDQQLNIVYLLRRVIFLERALDLILTENQIFGLHLEKKLKITDAKQRRQRFNTRKRIYRLAESKPDQPVSNSNQNLPQSAAQMISEQLINPQNRQKQDQQQSYFSDCQEDQQADQQSRKDMLEDYKKKLSKLKRQFQYEQQSQSAKLSRKIYDNIDKEVKKILDNPKYQQKFHKSLSRAPAL